MTAVSSGQVYGHPDRPQTWSEFLSPGLRVRIVILAALIAATYASTLRALVFTWNNDGNWSHGWLVPFFSLYFLATRDREIFKVQATPNYLGAVTLALSLAAGFVFGWAYKIAYLQALTLLTTILSTILLMGGWKMMKAIWFPVMFLIFAIPLPQGLYVLVTMPLRQLASQVAGVVLPILVPDLTLDVQSVVIEWSRPGRVGVLNVEEACSGMRLMMAFVTLGVATAYLGDRPFWQRMVMVVSCIPISIFCNALRVTITGLLHVHGRDDLAEGTPHQLLGIVMLLVALGGYSLIGYLLANLFVEEEDDAVGATKETS